jgi:hypothetical protein
LKIKLIDYDVEHKGFWNYGFRFWLVEELTKNEGKKSSNVLLRTSDLVEVIEKLKLITSEGIAIEIKENESFKKYRRELQEFL